MGKAKALGASVVAFVIAACALYVGVPEVQAYIAKGEVHDCQEFLQEERPSYGHKVRLTKCTIQGDGIFGISVGLGSDIVEVYVPLVSQSGSNSWQLALATEDEGFLEVLENNTFPEDRLFSFEGTISGEDGEQLRTDFKNLRPNVDTFFLVEPTLVGLMVGLGFCGLGLFCLLGGLGGIFIAVTGYEN